MHKFKFALLAGIAALALSACATGNVPSELRVGLSVAEAGYSGYCANKPADKACTPATAAKVGAAVKLASEAIDTYEQAQASGTASQALLDHANALIADVVKLVASLKKPSG